MPAPLNKARVVIVRLDDYDPARVARALAEALEPLGGKAALAREGERVVLKPNLLWASSVERAVCTHPEIVRQIARLARAAGAGAVAVTDSPGVGTARRCAKRLGLEDDADFAVVDADDPVELSIPGAPFQRLAVSRRMREADALINLPKAKTHGQMVLTGAVKNTFGAVVGFEKAQWHYRTGRDPRAFARLLVHLHALIAPRLNVLDAVIGMEGNGPGSGTPRRLGCLIASDNGHALDAVLCRVVDVDPANLYTLAAASELGLCPRPDEVEVIGPPPESLRPSPPWVLARPVALRRLAGPTWLAPIVDSLLSLKPAIDPRACTRCGACLEACAAGAMSLSAGRVAVDKDRCIACFCCQEMCPARAIAVRAGPIARLLGIGTR